MSNRTDWKNVAAEIVASTLSIESAETDYLRDRIAVELHNAYVAGQEGSPPSDEVDATDIDAALEAALEQHRNGATLSKSLDRFRTVAFDRELMRQTISVGIDGRIEAAAWFEGVVPECYRPAVLEIVNKVVPQFMKRKLSADLLRNLIDTLHASIFESLQPIDPGEV